MSPSQATDRPIAVRTATRPVTSAAPVSDSQRTQRERVLANQRRHRSRQKERLRIAEAQAHLAKEQAAQLEQAELRVAQLTAELQAAQMQQVKLPDELMRSTTPVCR